MLVMSKEATSASSSRCSFRARHFSKEGLPGTEEACDTLLPSSQGPVLQPPQHTQPHPSCPGLPALLAGYTGAPCVSGRSPGVSCSFDGLHRPEYSALVSSQQGGPHHDDQPGKERTAEGQAFWAPSESPSSFNCGLPLHLHPHLPAFGFWAAI